MTEGLSTGSPEMPAVDHIDFLMVLQSPLPGPSEGVLVGEYFYFLSDSGYCLQSGLRRRHKGDLLLVRTISSMNHGHLSWGEKRDGGWHGYTCKLLLD